MIRKVIYIFITILFIVNCSLLTKNTNKKEFSHSYSNYYKLSAIADSLHFIKDYQKSFETMDTVFKKLKPLNINVLFEYTTYLKNKYILKKPIDVNEVEKLIKDCGYISRDSIINLICKEKKITESRYKELCSQYEKSLDLDLRKRLIEALEEDQKAMKLSSSEYQKEVTLKHEKMLIDLFESGIYPNHSVIGPNLYNESYIALEILLMNTRDSVRINYFLPKIKKFIKEGKCYDVSIYCSMIDQMSSTKKNVGQTYGTGNMKKLDKKDYPKYNYNRRKLDIGCTSIQYDVWCDERYNK